MASPPIKCALLGTNHGHALGKLRACQQSADWEVVGVCEPDDAIRRRRQSEAAWQNVRWLSEAELLNNPGVQMIAVESDVPDLLRLGRQVIEAGKHLHLDKPAGTDLRAFRALLDTAQRKHLIVQMGYMFRYNGGFNLIRRALREGWLGEAHYVHANMSTNLNEEARRKLIFHPGGIMLELGCHLIDLIVLLLGRPTRVTPFLRHHGVANDGLADNTAAMLEYGRTLVVVESSCIEQHPFQRRQFEICGSKGSMVLQPLEPPALRAAFAQAVGDFEAGWQTVAVDNIPRYVPEMAELAKCLRREREFPYSYEHDFTVQETVLRACGTIR